MSVTTSRFHPAPGERSFQPGTTTQVLHKDGREVADFLSRLALEHKVFELEGRACPTVYLHPTFYGFGFTDSEGVSHGFEYSVEAGRHQDDTYRALVEEFEQFFEVRRMARSLYEAEIRREAETRRPEPPGRRGRLRRKFWYLISLFLIGNFVRGRPPTSPETSHFVGPAGGLLSAHGNSCPTMG